jgi:undecaprenyl-diphosphatase
VSRSLLLVSGALVVLAVVLGLAVHGHSPPGFDAAAVRGLHRALVGRRLAVDGLRVVTVVGTAPFLLLVVVLPLARRSTWGWSVVLAVALAGAEVVERVAKPLFDRPRPVVAHPFAVGTGPSYPSGHALQAAAVLGVVALIFGRWWLPGAVVALVAFSRVALGVHYPTDVVGGVLFGGAVVSAVAALPRTRALLRPRPR